MNEAVDASPVCRDERFPDAGDAVTSDDAEQASAAVLAALFKKGARPKSKEFGAKASTADVHDVRLSALSGLKSDIA